MARKSIKGYAEKNYYDNTRFGGGIVATNDPLNEGYFKSLVNFDISDTGYSIQPRKGFFTTTFKINDVTYILSDETIYFYDANIGKHIFIDFKQTYTEQGLPLIILADFNFGTDKMYLTNAKICTKFNWESVQTYLGLVTVDPNVTLSEIKFVQPKAELAVDKYGIPKYIVKVKYTYKDNDNKDCIFEFWASFVYRENETKYEGVTYSADTLVMEYIDFTDTVSINMTDRNIASNKSIIPNPIQYIYKENDTPPYDFIQQFPLIYVKDNGESGTSTYTKYLLNTSRTLDKLKFIPYFNLKDDPDFDWYYTCDAYIHAEDYTYKHPIFKLDYNKHEPLYSIVGDIIGSDDTTYTNYVPWIDSYNKLVTYYMKTYWNFPGEWSNYPQYLQNISTENYNLLKNPEIPTYVIYVCPIHNDESIRIETFDDFLDAFDNRLLNTYIEEGSGKFDGKYIGPYKFKQKDGNLNEPSYHNPDTTYLTRDTPNLSYLKDKYKDIYDFIDNQLSYMIKDKVKNFCFYICPVQELSYSTSTDTLKSSSLSIVSRLFITADKGYTYDELREYFKDKDTQCDIILKLYDTCSNIDLVYNDTLDPLDALKLENIFPSYKYINSETNIIRNYLYTNLRNYEFALQYAPIYKFTNGVQSLTFEYSNYTHINSLLLSRLFQINYEYNGEYSPYKISVQYPLVERSNTLEEAFYQDGTIYKYNQVVAPNFTIPWDLGVYKVKCNDKPYYPDLVDWDTDESGTNHYIYVDTSKLVFGKFTPIYANNSGITINFYLMQLPKDFESIISDEDLRKTYNFSRANFVASTSLAQSRTISYSSIEPSTIIETLTEEPGDISSASNSLIFRSTQGDHLVLYKNNKLYISEANNQHYFKYTKTFSYPEHIVKVIQYKDTLLVFTTQNLYSVYPIEVTENVESGIDAEGNKQYTQITTTEYGSLPVLYNLLVDEKYRDAIQVYNQMVLFYSADGQMFMIKPTATIDSNTRFSIQYFNKNANDILLNYTDYIRDRLRYYGYEIDNSIEQALNNINIKVSVTLNNIKIFYCVPGVITYILVYDIINNRYYVYDTLSFTNVKHLEFIPEGELYIVEYNNQLYFTQPYVIPLQKNNNVDLTYFHGFTPEPILTELDTGIENLNNHLKKRFKDLHIIYKNISAESVEFSLDVFVDNVPISTYINPEIQVQNISSSLTYTVCSTYATKELINNNNTLFDFSQFNSSKILTHKTSIISRGKTIRTKLCFKSDGVYKIQGYGLIYKEHTV